MKQTYNSLAKLSLIVVFFTVNTTYCLANKLDRAEVFVSQLSASILEIVESSAPLEEKHKNLRHLFEDHANIKTISRAALGAKWRSIDKNLRFEFSEVFKTYLIRKYGKQFGDFNGAKMILERSIDAGKRGILVNTRFIMPGTLPISVKWQIWGEKDNLKLIDIIIEDISMLTMEREEIKNRLSLNNGDIEALLRDLKLSK